MYHDTTIATLAACASDFTGEGVMSRIYNAVAREISVEREEQRIFENRRAAQREIAGLPANLRYDLAFSDYPIATSGRI